MTSGEREEISRGLAADESSRAIAARLKRPPSTISREVNRNAGRTHYRAGDAEAQAWHRAERPKPCRLAGEAKLRALVAVEREWSPERIAG